MLINNNYQFTLFGILSDSKGSIRIPYQATGFLSLLYRSFAIA